MMKYAIIKNDYQNSIALEDKLRKQYLVNGWVEDENNPDFVFIIGGDGTFLQAVQRYNQIIGQVSFVPFKNGGIGFYTNHNRIGDEKKIIQAIVDNKYSVHHFDLLDVRFDKKIYYAANEVKIINEKKAIFTDVYIGTDFLETFHGTGIALATANGTTGYLKSTGGSVIMADLNLMEFQEIFPVNSNIYRSVNAPLILGPNDIVTLKGEINQQVLVIDTLEYPLINPQVEIQVSSKKIQVVTCSSINPSKVALIRDIFVKDQK
ncbi:inorganic polyphosphate/ATP-NAD kinase [Spiroplasma sabaudiense Ar-1343]|uniref:Inorganic polyphosphate/ATP-NAD kinase n=1 Tax=Spiroplasma sabaudiense Ar-1343 TaxID=1276257 RepID=W6AAZ4_9MOLU|nr:NAD(+)/NADH kinase [Spiroplasma sabaudiense]AHI54192.1 inorganic polyphosphate/ATP-NAD kinase [Spiroplasma sabaudiense Ar-1343]